MSLNSKIVDPATGLTARVEPDRSLRVMPMPYPPTSDHPVEVFRVKMALPDGSTSMLVDGSVTEKIFSVNADRISDIYITQLSFLIVDASATLAKFGNLTALTVGCSLEYDSTRGSVVIDNALKSNFDLVRLCAGEPSFGSGGDAFRGNNVIGNSDAFFPSLDIQDVFGMPYGIRLGQGSDQALRFHIHDDITLMDAMDVIAFGFRRFTPSDPNLSIQIDTPIGG
tara:strand:+ start:20362 stop:21036 length:675 start_codon:yes stop_codon:yes gene_type:complete